MVGNAGTWMGNATAAEVDSADNAQGIGQSPPDRAVSGRHNPTSVVDPSTAKVRIGRRTQRDHVGKLAIARTISADDASAREGCKWGMVSHTERSLEVFV